jgi:hypothetical protein
MREIDANTLKRPWVLKFAAADVTRYISQLDNDTLSKLLEAAEAEQFRRIDDADYAAAYPEVICGGISRGQHSEVITASQGKGEV